MILWALAGDSKLRLFSAPQNMKDLGTSFLDVGHEGGITDEEQYAEQDHVPKSATLPKR